MPKIHGRKDECTRYPFENELGFTAPRVQQKRESNVLGRQACPRPIAASSSASSGIHRPNAQLSLTVPEHSLPWPLRHRHEALKAAMYGWAVNHHGRLLSCWEISHRMMVIIFCQDPSCCAAWRLSVASTRAERGAVKHRKRAISECLSRVTLELPRPSEKDLASRE